MNKIALYSIPVLVGLVAVTVIIAHDQGKQQDTPVPSVPSTPPSEYPNSSAIPEADSVDTLIQKKVSIYEDAVDVLYNYSGNEATNKIHELENQLQKLETEEKALSGRDKERMKNSPALLEVMRKYKEAIENVKIGKSSL